MYQAVLCHHGILGQKWGVRRFQNADGSLTDAGRKRYQNADGSLNDKAEKHIRENMFKNSLMNERNKVGKKANDELNNTKEAKEYNELMKNRQVVIKDKNGKVVKSYLSYMHDDWSNPDKVMDQMIKDMQIEDAYHKKDVEITNKYLDEFSGALLKDLGYNDTKAGREFLIKKGILSKYS